MFSVWFNKRHGRKGTLWEERFKSLLVEGRGGTDGPDGLGGLLAVAAYIDLNPVRAGLCDNPKDYRWCSYAAATGGDRVAREGLAQCVTDDQAATWRGVARRYRILLFGAGEERVAGENVGGRERRRRGFTQKQIDKVLAKGGRLPVPDLLRCRVRYFTEGVALGGRRFLEEFTSGGEVCEPAGADWGGLGVAGQLRGRPIEAPG